MLGVGAGWQPDEHAAYGTARATGATVDGSPQHMLAELLCCPA